ncbi:hypothetical protein WA026_006152 [Henosepilachna vigintioctopunctata]|uniref:Uncharacterized protein n=1 Tax=Henosepilachna vigintioctopunctata TaxID=420089 RepID=A0AAW1TN21_9CUCU
MKIKLPCKVCELSMDQRKMTGDGCTHTPFVTPLGQIPSVVPPLGMGVQNGMFHLPQLRDFMLAAYLLSASGTYHVSTPCECTFDARRSTTPDEYVNKWQGIERSGSYYDKIEECRRMIGYGSRILVEWCSAAGTTQVTKGKEGLSARKCPRCFRPYSRSRNEEYRIHLFIPFDGMNWIFYLSDLDSGLI